MFKIFQRIRLKLIDQGNLQKYLAYAVGEIILVVVGILLALQINSWNEARKAMKLENQYLVNISNEIRASLVKLDQALDFNQTTLEHIENIIIHLEEGMPYSPSLDTSFFIYQYSIIPELNFTTYETIKNVGLNSISSHDLRLTISKLYEEDFIFLTNTIRENEKQFYQNVMTQFHIEHFKETTYASTTSPNNYKSLQQNQKYNNILHKLKGIRTYSNFSIESVRKKTAETLNTIEQKINKYNK